ncbi:MAG: hypothetical protein NWE96_00770 [Candidatus Bathyarchaeota archaeon]|nr:hypothetical protein [Candidatus Bathyarchaeota archaeon]
MLESRGIIASSRFKIETALKQRNAFDEKTAISIEDAKIGYRAVLDVMERSGLISMTPEGKVFMTKKGQEQQIRGFTISNDFPNKKFVRFSRNK